MTEPNNLLEAQKIVGLELAVRPGEDIDGDWMSSLVQRINFLIIHDFERLVSILYRLDVDESKVKLILKNTQRDLSNNSDPGLLISKLIIERQLQKLRTRNEYREQKKSSDDNERW